MFSITAEGHIFHDGVMIGRVEHDSTTVSRKGNESRSYTVRSRMVENEEGDVLLSTRIAAAGTIVEAAA